MKPFLQISTAIMVFAGILLTSSPNYAGTIAFHPSFGIRPPALPKILKEKMDLQSPPLLFKKKSRAAAAYNNAWKASRIFAVSA